MLSVRNYHYRKFQKLNFHFFLKIHLILKQNPEKNHFIEVFVYFIVGSNTSDNYGKWREQKAISTELATLKSVSEDHRYDEVEYNNGKMVSRPRSNSDSTLESSKSNDGKIQMLTRFTFQFGVVHKLLFLKKL